MPMGSSTEIFKCKEETKANKGRKNHFPKPNILWSPAKLATRLGGFPKLTFSHPVTLKFLVDNKPFRRRMWEKVAVSGQASRGRGQRWNDSRRQWNLRLTARKTARTNPI
jgi:hypothetical protein